MIVQADILQWCEVYEGPKFHALLCDAPYEMEFMGKDWDNTGIAFDPETWKAIARHLYPGAFLFVFAGTINDDLISVAMRQAGLRKYHKATYWGFGSGFPKATNLPAQIDEDAFQRWLAGHDEERAMIAECRDAVQVARKAHKAGSAPRSAVTAAHNAYRAKRLEVKAAAGFLRTNGTKKHQPKFAAAELGYREKDNGFNSKEHATFDVSAPATPMAQTWDGYSYGGQMIKPAVETILIFQKPYQGRPVECITRTGAGSINIAGGRIGESKRVPSSPSNSAHIYGKYSGDIEMGVGGKDPNLGRWPANLILSHSPACNGTCAPDCPVRRLGEQSGERAAGSTVQGTEPSQPAKNVYESGLNRVSFASHDDAGTAARFFYQADWMLNRLETADPVAYYAKASRSEREAGLDPRQIALLGREEQGEGTINDGRQKSIDNPYQRGETVRRNIHPTLKPLSLCRYLATLLLPPALYAPRRLLIPFAGAGSEMIGAMLAGWEDVVGVELAPEHVAIAEARLAYWRQRAHEYADPSKPIAASLSEAPVGQIDMFDDEVAA